MKHVLKQVLDLLEKVRGYAVDEYGDEINEAIATLEAAIAQPDSEPVFWCFKDSDGKYTDGSHTQHSVGMIPLYAAPVHQSGCTSNCDTCKHAWGSPANTGYCHKLYWEPNGVCQHHKTHGEPDQAALTDLQPVGEVLPVWGGGHQVRLLGPVRVGDKLYKSSDREAFLAARVADLEAELAAIKKQPAVGQVDEDDSGLFVDLEMPEGVWVKRGQLVYAAAGASPVPEGYQLVKSEPDNAMIEAGSDAYAYAESERNRQTVNCIDGGMLLIKNRTAHVYKAMLQAAKEPA